MHSEKTCDWLGNRNRCHRNTLCLLGRVIVVIDKKHGLETFWLWKLLQLWRKPVIAGIK